jgi:hypothetical protein
MENIMIDLGRVSQETKAKLIPAFEDVVSPTRRENP